MDWKADVLECDLCNYNWVAVYVDGTDRMQCPNCNNMVYYNIITYKYNDE